MCTLHLNTFAKIVFVTSSVAVVNYIEFEYQWASARNEHSFTRQKQVELTAGRPNVLPTRPSGRVNVQDCCLDFELPFENL